MPKPQVDYIKYIPSPGNIKRIGRLHTALYRATGGLVGGKVDGLEICLLTTLGRKSGQKRTVPLPYFRAGQGYLLVGSFGGNAKHPAWVHNVTAEPEVAVQIGFRRLKARARAAEGEERAELWQGITRDFPRYEAYQQKTERQIPVIVLEPVLAHGRGRA